jgi:hypothetical protein
MIVVMVVVLRQSVLPEVLVSQVPRPQSRMVHPPEESRAAALAAVARPLVPTDQLADIQCSSKLCGEYEPSKIWKWERIR